MKYVSLLFAFACFTLPAAASAQPPSQGHDVKQSESLAQQAYEANAKGDYQNALALYQQAYKAAPAGVILFNIANLYDKRLKDREAAIDYYKRYINSSDTEADLVKRASDRIAALKAEKDAQASANTASAKPAAVPAPAQTQTQQPPPPDKDTGGDSGSTMRAVGITVGVVGLVAVGVGAGFGISASSKASRANELCTGSECRSPEGVTLTDDARSAATVSTVGFIVGGALLATGIALFFIAPASGKSATATRISPVAMPGGGGLYLGKAW